MAFDNIKARWRGDSLRIRWLNGGGSVLLVFAGADVHAAAAAQKCNPPRPNLEYADWRRDCDGMLQMLFSTNNPYRLPYGEFIRMYWQMYEVVYHPERHPGLAGSRCAPEGSGFMNPSGHAQICRGGRWQVAGN
jgi:hypothetical protein